MRSLFYFKKEGKPIEEIKSEFLTIKELCEQLEISRKYAYQFIKDNKIEYLRIGRKFYVSKKSLKKYLGIGD